MVNLKVRAICCEFSNASNTLTCFVSCKSNTMLSKVEGVDETHALYKALKCFDQCVFGYVL